MASRKYFIYTKGSANPTDHISAYGYKIIDKVNGQSRQGTNDLYGGTANRAELLAIIKALEKIVNYRPNHIFQDSFNLISPSNNIIRQLSKRYQITYNFFFINGNQSPYYSFIRPPREPLIAKIASLTLHFINFHIIYLEDKSNRNNMNLKYMTNKALNKDISFKREFHIPTINNTDKNKLMSYYSKNKDKYRP